MAEVNNGMTAAETAALINSLMPTMAVTTPPGVTDSGTSGPVSNQFTGPLHTHASKARKGIQAVSAATYVWTFPTPFGSGVVPICNGIAQTTAGVTDLYNVQIDGVPTNTQVTFRITRYSQSVVALIGLTILSFNSSPGSINLHMSALEP